ncbi:class Ib ribonucleoside-diphosphate reductase assembly flavoprotein NrdI [Bacillus sp. 1P06AnD]|uniref:class Ib ribonucleoside-diphosphate reductase assembly flavoprotein NrdI n=1 Tax=Bacillus sp. 1P06AnD TaxID=3132208 RepID=UPI0039A0C94B
MLLVFDSLTGNVQRFVEKLDYEKTIKITDGMLVDEPYILVTYTFDFGGVPESTAAFLERNGHLLQGVASSGNKVWGSNFALAADTISNQYLVPVMLKFELSGMKSDIEAFKQEVARIYERTNSKVAQTK